MKVTVIGGGNIGTLLAAELSLKGNEVYLHSSKKWNDKIEVYDENDNFIFESKKITVTDDLKFALTESKYVFITYPAELFEDLSYKLDGKIENGTFLGIIPGSGGAEFAFKNLIDQGAILFGFQRVHSIARIKEPGKSVYMLGRKDSINVAVFKNEKEKTVQRFLENNLNMPCYLLNHYLTMTLNPSNPILHTSRLYILFNEYQFGDTYPENILFYETWDDESSDLLIKCDEELQKLCDAIPFDLNGVKSLKEHYESPTISDMTNKISNIPAYKGLTSPMKINDDREWIPDFSSRYFSSDFPYGLKIILDISTLYNTPHENLKKIWNWFLKVTKSQSYFSIERYDLDTKEKFEKYYDAI